jgi:metal-sulfur cluster biosynthetic enzyme
MKKEEVDLETCLQEVRDALSEVCDPELDEPVTDLGFIQDIFIGRDRDIMVTFRLPTYWCAANFAFLMASDMQNALARLPWAGQIGIQLVDHYTSAEVSSGASSGQSFRQSFSGEAEEDLDGIRLIFQRKSFQKRQEKLLRYLLAKDPAISDLVSMSLTALEQLPLDSDGIILRERYLRALALLSFQESPWCPAFHDVEGKPLDPIEFAHYLQRLRSVRINAEVNGAFCRSLLEVRYGVKQQDGLVQIERVAARESGAVLQPPRQRAEA